MWSSVMAIDMDGKVPSISKAGQAVPAVPVAATVAPMGAPPMVLQRVEHAGRLVDVAVRDGRVEAVTSPAGAAAARPGTVVVDGQGGALLPGLHDHHLHLLALAASLESVAVGPPAVTDEAALRAALRAAATTLAPGGWLRAVGYHERVAGELDRGQLDAAVADHPVRVQHRSGALWILNSPALAEVGLLDGSPAPDGCERTGDGAPTGRLFRMDGWLADRVPRRPPDLARVGRMLAERGVTGVTDATPFSSADQVAPIVAALVDGHLPQHVIVTGSPALEVAALPPSLPAGPAKLLLADHDLPTPDAIAELVRTARGHGRAVAVHCVTREALVVTLAAFHDAGTVTGDRIEHGAVVPAELRPDLARLGLTVVTQPNFVAERGDDYLADVDPQDLADLWPCRSLVAAGIAVAGGTDAPFGHPDPWRLVDAAVHRRAPSGAVVGPDERLGAPDALDLLLRPGARPYEPPRRVAVGAAADLCVLTAPLAEALAAPAEVTVRFVVIGGRVHHR